MMVRARDTKRAKPGQRAGAAEDRIVLAHIVLLVQSLQKACAGEQGERPHSRRSRGTA
jgi:hypothetical protein